MTKSDAVRWNSRYSEPGRSEVSPARELLTKFSGLIPMNGWVLDMAMGTGGNSLYLRDQGFLVLGIDISLVALLAAKRRNSGSSVVLGDSPHIPCCPNEFSAILNFYFLDRALFPVYSNLLKPGGLLFFESPCEGHGGADQSFPKEFLLKRNELIQFFAGWDILYRNRCLIESATGHRKVVDKVILRKV